MNSSIEDNKNLLNQFDDFKNWLISSGFSAKSANDYRFRLIRITKYIHQNIDECIENNDKYLILMAKIHNYSIEQAHTVTSQYSIRGTLRSALKKYAAFKYPELYQSLPNAYGKKIPSIASKIKD